MNWRHVVLWSLLGLGFPFWSSMPESLPSKIHRHGYHFQFIAIDQHGAGIYSLPRDEMPRFFDFLVEDGYSYREAGGMDTAGAVFFKGKFPYPPDLNSEYIRYSFQAFNRDSLPQFEVKPDTRL